MTPDRVVYSFVLGWVLLIGVLIVLDWLGNPNRGQFRPKGDRRTRNRRERRDGRRRRRAERDAGVRSTLRDAYGASSLRLTWTRAREDAVRGADDALVVTDRTDREDVVEVASREVVTMTHTAVIGDPLPNIAERAPDGAEEPEPDAKPERREPETEPGPPPVGWRVGVDPLTITRAGRSPTPATIRSRVWKNLAVSGAWHAENLERLQAGRPPRRTNPITGERETARVDVESGTASWGDDPLDPFEAGS